MNSLHRLALVCIALAWALLGSGCSTTPDTPHHPSDIQADIPAAWMAPLPHEASTGTLQQWWSQLGDPLLVELIAAAEKVSPTLASAASRLAQSRSLRAQADAASQPTLDANLSAQRGINANFPSVGTALQSNLNASWEIDLFGANHATASAADARQQSAQAQWHAARVSVAAEVAGQYLAWQVCAQQLDLLQQDVNSHTQSARLAMLTAHAGLASPVSAALANASTADAQGRTAQQQNQCDSAVKALVELTAMAEPDLRQRLQSAPRSGALRALPSISSVPAQVMAQRPDLYAAQRDVAAASADIGAAQAHLYPSLSVGGSVGTLSYSNAQGSTDLNTWSVGPITLDLPLFDGARRATNVDTAKAHYVEAAALYRAKVRQAAREVEDALLSLAASDSRQQQSQGARAAYQLAFDATRQRFQIGTANLSEVEESRRTLIAAQINLLQLQLERSNAWIALYRALGGGWNAFAQAPTTPSDPH